MPAPAPPDDAPSATARLRALASAAQGWTPRQSHPATPVDMSPAVVDDPSWRDRLVLAASRRSLGWLLMVGLAVVAATALMLTRHHAGGTSSATDAAPPAPGPAVAAASAAARIVIDVGGHVRHPGLVTLQLGARVADAIAAAGGALDPSDVATLDLAARVSDGQLLLIGVPGAPSLGGTGSAAPVSLNSATVEQLDALPGVGPVLAQRIISWRDAHGGFRTLDELQQVPGIGARKYADLKALVSV